MVKARSSVHREKRIRARGYGPLLEEVARKHHCTPEEVTSGNHAKHISRARQELLVTIYNDIQSYSATAYITGFDHRSIMKAVAKGSLDGSAPPSQEPL